MSLDSSNGGGELYCPVCEKSFPGGEYCPTDTTRLVRIAPPTDTLIGRELQGRYKILERIGEGGMGTVYRGKQHSVGRECAIKVISPGLVSHPVAIKRFLREATLASRLAHPNAVSVLDCGQTDDGLFFLVMELVVGRTLDTIIAEGRLPADRVVRIGAQICEALEGAHALGIIHRDLKPANVMVLATGRDPVKVLDFGLAKSLSPQSETPTTHAGALLGTPAYMPPEVINGQSSDARADLYSLGCLLYEAVSGCMPFTGGVAELLAAHVNARPPRLLDVSPKLASVIMRLLAKSPGERFRSAAHTREALEKALDKAAVTSRSPEAQDGLGGGTLLGWSSSSSGGGATHMHSDTVRVAPPALDLEPDDATDPERAEPPRRRPQASAPGHADFAKMHTVPGTRQPTDVTQPGLLDSRPRGSYVDLDETVISRTRTERDPESPRMLQKINVPEVRPSVIRLVCIDDETEDPWEERGLRFEDADKAAAGSTQALPRRRAPPIALVVVIAAIAIAIVVTLLLS